MNTDGEGPDLRVAAGRIRSLKNALEDDGDKPGSDPQNLCLSLQRLFE